MDLANKDGHSCGEKQCEASKEFYMGDDHRFFIKKFDNIPSGFRV